MGYLEKKLQAIIMAQGWKFKTGNLYDLTSNTSWAEGTPSVKVATSESTLGTTRADSYLSFDNDGNTRPANEVVTRLYGEMKWIKPRILVKITSKVYQNQNNNSVKTRKLYGIKKDNSTVLLETKTNPLNSGNQTLNETWNITDETEFYGLAIDIYENYQGRYIYLWELQVTEWYEKGQLLNYRITNEFTLSNDNTYVNHKRIVYGLY